MKPRLGWLLLRENPPPGDVHPEHVCVIIPSRKVTNKAVDDIVREHHLREFGRLWPNKVSWRSVGKDRLILKTPLCTYKLLRMEVYG